MKTIKIFLIFTALVFGACAKQKPETTDSADDVTTIAVQPIKIGELMPYTVFPEHIDDYRRGWRLAVEEINAKGGVLGRPLEVIARDEQCDPGVAIRVAQELLDRDNVFMWLGAGCTASAITDLSKRLRVPFISSWTGYDSLVWENQHPYHFGFGAPVRVLAEIYADLAAQQPHTRWATVGPNAQYGYDMVGAFVNALKERRPDIEIVEQQWPSLSNVAAAETIQALANKEPEALYLMVYGADLAKLLRQGRARGFFENKFVIGDQTGLEFILNTLGSETPVGWHACGYPTDLDETHPGGRFAARFNKRFGLLPDRTAAEAYTAIYFTKAAIEKAGRVDREAFITTLPGMSLDTPFGNLHVREKDLQVEIACWFGKTNVKDGKGVFVDYEWVDAEQYFPSDEEIAAMRG
ncbi:MAG: ABC transporter substrate-binding protein, partial [Gammaproteobacteria bacterium]|nr:ABC transporter substrate-binding protein [Gammaproteobacteria bacterium]